MTPRISGDLLENVDMRGCVTPRDIEGLVQAKLSDRRTTAVTRHLEQCARCAQAIENAQADENWLRKALDDDELPQLRRQIADAASAATQPTGVLTDATSEG